MLIINVKIPPSWIPFCLIFMPRMPIDIQGKKAVMKSITLTTNDGK